MIQITHLTKVYGKQKVLDDISTEFNKGIIYGLIGVNGCGKTTLMRCICGFTRPTSGTVTVSGKVIGVDVDFPCNTGIIIETPGFLPQYSGFRNLQMLADISGKANKNQVREAIKLLGLDPADKKPVGKYSLGMRQRLGIAQALLEDPDILILDEPFNGLDKEAMIEVHELFKELKHKGKIIILASHNLLDIQKACDVLYEIQDGHLSISVPEDSTYIHKPSA